MVRHRIILCGGGTGGHIYPALAVAEHLRDDPNVEAILYMGAKGHLEEKLAQDRKLDFIGLQVSGLPRKLTGHLLAWPFEMMRAIFEAKKVLSSFKPTVVLGVGGYASAPPLIAALMLGVPIAIHESDAHPGLVSRFCAPRAQLVSIGMAAAAMRLKASRGQLIFNGNPVRKSFSSSLSCEGAAVVLGLNKDLKTVLVTGGSQGAQAINEALIFALPALLDVEPPIQIIHQAGEKNVQEIKSKLDRAILQNPRYCLRAYFDDLALPYAVSDLAICRAGAMTIAELSVTGTPAIFIPYPYAAANHQAHNANYMEELDAAVVLPQRKLNAQTLHDKILELLVDDEHLNLMRKQMAAQGKPEAALNLANQVKALSSTYITR